MAIRLAFRRMENFSERLARLMREHGYKQLQLQEITGATSGTTSNWISGATCPRGNSLQLLAAHFKVEADWLLNGGQDSVQEARAAYRSARGSLPLHSYASLKHQQIPEQAWLTLGSEIPNAFAVRIEGTAMAGPQGIPDGAVAICDPARVPQNNDIVLVGPLNVRIRRYSAEGEQVFLLADHPGFPAVTLESEEKILGVVVGYTVVL